MPLTDRDNATWAILVEMILLLRDEGALTDAALAKLVSRLRQAATKIEQNGQPEQARTLRRDADFLAAARKSP